ncbi:MAG TPA: helix-turn-helix transcriptional regulator, partial [Dongiaceae bacterium]|nr:helix-turn-helix transcriptional regulator [Dongiaceae bacterium]
PCGVGDHGSGLVLRQDLFDEILERRHPRAAEDGRRLPPWAPCPTTALARQWRLLRAAESPGGADPLGAEEAALAIAEEVLGSAAGRPTAPGDPAAEDDPAGSPPARHRDLAEGVRTHLGRAYRTPLRLEGIAAALGSTPAHLCRVFRRVTGTTIHAYLTRLRLSAALEPLRAGTEDLSGLAFDLGFSSHSHFTHAFRREFGAPPSQLRGTRSKALQARI